ncbi:leptin receptor isoform X2 [Melanotaenia boesemani]|uniref:leptin receptor isoform X2 n=1 Tax=Melanotaenia boesemani TaxID=1250792 RepID=UPI001C0473E9|nr:leptin receptor isoform X2 [Melanotaenia boesemani]
MVRSVMLKVLMHIFLLPHAGVQCLMPEDKAFPLPAAFKLPWRDELCCDSPLVQFSVKGGAMHAAETNCSESNLPHCPRCNFRNSRESQPNEPPGGTCLDIQCRIGESWPNLTCEFQHHNQPSGTLRAGRTVVSFQQLFEKNSTEVSNPASMYPIVCKGEDTIVCSLHVDPARNFVTMVTVNISNAMAPPVLLRNLAVPVKPSPPVSLSHFQTNKAELIVQWKDPSDFSSGPLRYEVQYSFSTTHPTIQVVSVSDQPRVSLHLEPFVKYTIQVRCSSLEEPPLWSNWSKPHFIYLGEVSYIPEQVVAQTGENVSVYCVFNDRRMNASTAVWKLNGKELDHSLSHPVNEWVSQITFCASETGLYDELQCKNNFSIPYSQIYVQGGFIDINCMTSGDIDAMKCKWTNKERHTLILFFEWTSLTCDMMKEVESSGKEVLKDSSSCKAVKSSDKFCTISPLKVSYCYKLWMGLCEKDSSSTECTIQSKPIYISPLDHVKPHQPTNVMANSKSSGVLKVTWVRPKLPVQSLQFQYRLRSTDTENWKVQGPLQSHWAEVVVPNMCKVYIVQVRCMLKSGKGYWSDWSDSVKSIPENSRVPERGPNFWRIRQDATDRNHSNITVLFESFPVFWNSYCVDGFIIQHLYSDGSIQRERISQLSPYSFDWNQEHHTVTVEAFNSLGSSINNINMTLEKQPKRRCVKSFHVVLKNSTCASLSWSLLDSSSVPQFMVVQWFPQRRQNLKDYDWSQNSWVRLPYTVFPVYIHRVFLFEEYNFHLYPVFSDGEGEPVITSASRGGSTAYGMLMSISFLCTFLLVTLFFFQKPMKKLVWKDVPNPNKCSWAKGLDFKKTQFFSVDGSFSSQMTLHSVSLGASILA